MIELSRKGLQAKEDLRSLTDDSYRLATHIMVAVDTLTLNLDSPTNVVDKIDRLTRDLQAITDAIKFKANEFRQEVLQ